ncbi:hypothetical protein FRB99_008749 [Tulasnella sp. 403]|nr:hypothetical protein FRB99_008749 [Tulasnella sp. 403]
MTLSFAGHTVVITGAGGGLGRTYSLLFGSRGANVVVNDVSQENAQKVVDQIVKAGGKAVANTSSVTDGAAVIKTAIDNFGNVTIDKGFKNMSDAEFDAVYQVHVKGAFSVTKAAWPYFRKQKFGRVINTASAAGLFGNFGQANYSAAKMSLVTFTKTLAMEGAKYNIKSSCIAPIAASPMTATIMPPEMLESLSPDYIAPLVAVLSHPDGPDANGKVFELGAGFMAEIRWERTKGAVFRPDETYTPSAIKERWEEITDFTNPDHPRSMMDTNITKLMADAAAAKPATPRSEVRFDGKTVIITGAGAGLGRIYALMYAKLGANVVVNDVSEKGANSVVDEIKRAGGWCAQVRWQRSGGHGFPHNKPPTPEQVISQWGRITGFDNRATYPATPQESIQQIVENFNNKARASASEDEPEDPEIVAKAKRESIPPAEFKYTERDVILYNLGIGATEKELHWVFENDENFQAIPTFGVIPQFQASAGVSYDWLPGFNPAKLLHGEQFLSVKKRIPTSGTLTNHVKLLEVLDKGKAAAATVQVETRDEKGEVVFENQSTVFLRGCGGFGGRKTGQDRGAATAANVPPKRQPDAVVEEKTSESQAALYRLSGDLNPLHILPEFAAIGGFDKPILHGLCSLGIAGKHVLKTFGGWKDIKTRFAGVVVPGQTLVTEMWKEGDKVIFVSKVKETGKVALSSAAVTLVNGGGKIKAKL